MLLSRLFLQLPAFLDLLVTVLVMNAKSIHTSYALPLCQQEVNADDRIHKTLVSAQAWCFNISLHRSSCYEACPLDNFFCCGSMNNTINLWTTKVSAWLKESSPVDIYISQNMKKIICIKIVSWIFPDYFCNVIFK